MTANSNKVPPSSNSEPIILAFETFLFHFDQLTLKPGQPLNKPVFDERAIVKETPFPATVGVIRKETITIVFPSEVALRTAVQQPTTIPEEVLEKVVHKLNAKVGESLYPSQLAHLLFELAFVDAKGLEPKQRTDYMGYVLSNLGCGNDAFIEKLFAFYYGYSFQHFAKSPTPNM